MSETNDAVIEVKDLTLNYGPRRALDAVSFVVRRGECFGMLGPNGGGKTTLFRILATLLIPSAGQALLFGMESEKQFSAIRHRMGVVFQSSSSDRMLSVMENLVHQGRLYGLRGRELQNRTAELLEQFGLTERAGDTMKTLSGGLQRRAELAKGLLNDPELLLLDEPTTGLDPVARMDFWSHLERVRKERGITIFLNTHFMEEAESCDRLGILDAGKLVAVGSPAELKENVGGEVITIGADEPQALLDAVNEKFHLDAVLLDASIRIEKPDAHRFIPELFEAFPKRINSITVGKPTLEDVFMDLTGHRFEDAAEED